MRVTSITLDFAQLLALVVASVFAGLGLVSWYVVILLVLFSFHATLIIPIR